jgi:hypothetical protein
MEIFRASFLNQPKHLRVEAELQDCTCASFAGELRISDFIRPCTKRAWHLNALHDIRQTEPSSIAERTLHDDIGTAAHCVDRALYVRRVVSKTGEVDSLASAFSQRFDIPFLVLKPTIKENLKKRINSFRIPRPISVCDRQIERGAVATPKEIREVSR